MIRLLSLCAVIPSSICCLLFASLFVLSSLWFVSVLLIVGQFFVASFCVFVQFNVLNFVGRDPLHSPDSHQLLIVVTKIRPDQHRKSIKNHCVPENSSEKKLWINFRRQTAARNFNVNNNNNNNNGRKNPHCARGASFDCSQILSPPINW